MWLRHADAEGASGLSRLRFALVALLAAAALLTLTAEASAVIVHLKRGTTLSYQPVRGESHLAPFDALFTNLDYNGGPVMASNTNYAVYWRPSTGPAYPAEYQAGVNQYLEDLAHDSGGHENVESVSAQYNDSAGDFANYSSHFGGALIDENPYPSNGCKRATICLTDQQLQTELTKYTAEHGLPRDLSHEYFLLTPPGVEDCFEANGLECSAGVPEEEFGVYCAYHGNIPVGGGAQLIYSNDPFVNGVFGCDDGNHPNAKPSDSAIEGGLSHEHNESITDPEPNNAWTDIGALTGENGDKCRTFNASEEFGPGLGEASNKATYNQVINGHFYWYQQEWSNQGKKCLQRLTFSGAEPTATFTSEPGTGNQMSFNASASTATPKVFRYNWQFNDGPQHSLSSPMETSVPTVSHTFAKAGAYIVALTVLAQDGTSLGTARTIVTGDEGPAAAFTTSTAGQNASFDGSGSADPDGSITEYRWTFGDGSPAASGVTPSHGYATAGTFIATLTVKDSSGQTAVVSHAVTVAAGKAPQSITFTSAAPGAASVGGPSYHVTATGGGSGNPVTFSIAAAAASVCKISGSTVSFTGAGTCTINADQAGDASFSPAPQAHQSFTVGEASSGPPPEGPPPVAPTPPPVNVPLVNSPTPSTPAQGTASVLSGGPFTPPPNSTFGVLSSAYNAMTGAITFTQSVVDPGTLSWLLTFQNGRFGVFAASAGKCKKGFVSLNGRCRPSKIVYGKGSRAIGTPGTVSFTVKPSASALRALRNALRRQIGIPVTATLTFQSLRGGSPVSHTRLMFVRFRKK